MNIALIQTPLFWEQPQENRTYIEQKIRALDNLVNLIVLPEMFTSGFSMNPENAAETMQGPTVQWLKEMALLKNAAITGSLIIKDQKNYYNRLLFVLPSGELSFYDKRHLFTLAGEEKVYTAGKKKLVVDYLGFKICLLICYDLRFPVFSRNTDNYDLLIYVANWPQQRILAWDSLLRARAIENQCYTLGLNRCGVDGNGHLYNGHSQLIDPLGAFLVPPMIDEAVVQATLSIETITETRMRFNFLKDRDAFELEN